MSKISFPNFRPFLNAQMDHVIKQFVHYCDIYVHAHPELDRLELCPLTTGIPLQHVIDLFIDLNPCGVRDEIDAIIKEHEECCLKRKYIRIGLSTSLERRTTTQAKAFDTRCILPIVKDQPHDLAPLGEIIGILILKQKTTNRTMRYIVNNDSKGFDTPANIIKKSVVCTC